MVNFCKYSDNSITEGSDDTECITTTASVTAYHDDDELVCDSLSETEEHHSTNNENSFHLSSFFQHPSSKGKSPLFTNAPNNGLKDIGNGFNGNCQSFSDQNIFRNTSRNKIPLKAIDLDSTADINHFVHANDRSVVRNITPGRVVSGYANREKTLKCNFNQFDCPANQ